MSHPIKFYRYPLSGHAHRVELMLSLLSIPHETVFVDLATGAHKQPAFLALNAFGQVPVIEDRGMAFSDSNAILVYLASQYDETGRWLPRDPARAALVQRWLSVAAGELAGEEVTIADIALYSYVAHAPEGNVSLVNYPWVQAWLAQIERLPGFVPMVRSAVGLQSV